MLGIGATFGKGKEGDENAVRNLSEKLEFSAEYLPKTMIDGEPVSSGRIRSLIAKGAFHAVKQRLGRDYSIIGRCDGNEFYNLSLQGICLPPEGIYPVRLKRRSSLDLARAYVIPPEQKIRLDLFHETVPLHDEDIEVIF